MRLNVLMIIDFALLELVTFRLAERKASQSLSNVAQSATVKVDKNVSILELFHSFVDSFVHGRGHAVVVVTAF